MKIKDIKRELEVALNAIDTADAELGAGRLDPDAHRERRAQHEREAGRLFVELRRAQRQRRQRVADDADEADDVAAAAPTPWFRTPPAIAGMAFAGFLLVLGGVLGIAALSRTGPAPVTVAEPPAATPAVEPALGQMAMQALRQAGVEDNTVPGMLAQAHAALDGGQLAEARRLYDKVLARDPRNAEAITHLGAILYQERRVDEALAKVDEALRIDPQYIHALWDRVQYLSLSRRPPAAVIAAGQAFLAVSPTGPDADKIRAIMTQARAGRLTGGKSGS